jgi:hypothetical protein
LSPNLMGSGIRMGFETTDLSPKGWKEFYIDFRVLQQVQCYLLFAR